MLLISFYRFKSTIMILLTCNGIISFGKVSNVRNGGESDQAQCFNNLLVNLPNKSFLASSIWYNKPEFQAHQSRMSSMVDTSSDYNGQAWCSDHYIKSQPTEWLEIDLEVLRVIGSLFTMGRGDGNFKEFVSLFYLEYQREPRHWIMYKNEHNKKLMVANGDSRNVERIRFNSPIIARKLRIYPITTKNESRACMRIAIYGCNFDDGVLEYSTLQGHTYHSYDNDKYDFRDLTYDGKKAVNMSTNVTELVGGLGQLMDNVIHEGVIDIDKSRGHLFVGWNRKIIGKNEIEIQFKFDQIRELKNIQLYSLNMVSHQIGHFSSASLHFSIGGKIYDSIYKPYLYQKILDRHQDGSQRIDISLERTLARYLKLILVFKLDWIVLSEIIVITEKSDVILPAEKPMPYDIITTTEYHRNANQSHQSPTKTIITIPGTTTASTIIGQGHETSFIQNSDFGFIITICGCLFGTLLLLMLFIFGIISIRRHRKRIKRKYQYPNYSSKITGAPFAGDSLVVPLTIGTHSSSGTGSHYYRPPWNTDIGLSYPIMGKEYMTLSSKSGTYYDMTVGNSLDGLIPRSKDGIFVGMNPHFSTNVYRENPYNISTHSRHSIDDSQGSANTEYATTSLYHFNSAIEKNINTKESHQTTSFNNSFRLQNISPNHSNVGELPHSFQSSTPSAQILGPATMNSRFPQYSPYRNRSMVLDNSQEHLMTQKTYNVIQAENSLKFSSRFNTIHSIKGICGNSVMMSNIPKSVSLTDILSNLREISSKNMEHISVLGKGECGRIGFVQVFDTDLRDRTNLSKTTMFLFKSVFYYTSSDTRNKIVYEMGILGCIKHSAFLQMSSYSFDQQNTISPALCFLFQIDDQMENLYTCLQYHSTAINSCSLLRDNKAPIANPCTSPNLGTAHLYPSVPSLLYICCQISNGMSYLESHLIVHRDLAARNCLISKDMTVKITDIAMSIHTFSDHYIECNTVNYQSQDRIQTGPFVTIVKQNHPLQWMAFESILSGIYSVKTDVWSFGVTIWEILTRCQRPPYGEFSNTSELLIENANHMCSGDQCAIYPNGFLTVSHEKYRNLSNMSHVVQEYQFSLFESNLDVSEDLADLLKQCWHRNSYQRPSFHNISVFFDHVITKFDLKLLKIIS